MADDRSLVVRDGFGAGQLLLAFLAGAAAGYAAAILTSPAGAPQRAAAGELLKGPREALSRVPGALREASRAFTGALEARGGPGSSTSPAAKALESDPA